MPPFLSWLSYILTILSCSHGVVRGLTFNAADFQDDLQTIANTGLGVADMQTYLDGAGTISVTQTPVNGSAQLEQAVADLGANFASRFGLATNLQNNLQSSYGSFNKYTAVEECCRISTSHLEHDERFRGKVDRYKYCMRKSEFADSNGVRINSAILNVFIQNMNNIPAVKWQYFGTEDGLLFSYPAAPASDCTKYDPRFRPWYVETTNPTPRDVVVVIDTSGSMGTTLMNIAKDAGKAIIESVNPKDRIGVVAFSTNARTPFITTRGCYQSRLASATPETKSRLLGWVGTLTANGGTYYARAMTKAFELFTATPPDLYTNRKRVILFMTDGIPSDGNGAVEIIRTQNLAFNNTVTVFTFGVGQLPSGITWDTTPLYDMATQHQSQPGLFVELQDVKLLRKHMSSYYTHLGTLTPTEPYISAPYYDSFGIGMVVTVTLPVYFNGFRGVLGIDLSLQDLMAGTEHSGNDTSSYSFLTDEKGWAFMHPLLPNPDAVTEDPTRIHIETLETAVGVKDNVTDPMQRGEEGSVDLETVWTSSRGNSHQQGVTTRNVSATYYFKQIPGTNLSMCQVVEQGSVKHDTVKSGVSSPSPYVYHRLDLNTSSTRCRHFTRVSEKDQTAVKFAPKAFLQPFEYLDGKETQQKVNNYFTDLTTPGVSVIFRKGVKDDLVITERINGLWFTTYAAHSQAKFAVWRYIATERGVLRVAPAVKLQANYDPTVRPWYRSAVANRGKLMLSPPYLDAFGAGFVSTLSTTLTVGSGVIYGVMAIDFSVNYLYTALAERFTDCDSGNYRCFLMDEAGYLITHKSFVSLAGAESPVVENVHITVKESDVAQNLINNGWLVSSDCINLKDIRQQNYYEWSPSFSSYNNIGGNPSYKVEVLQNTGVAIGIISGSTGSSSNACSCHSETSPVPPQCEVTASCQCPCHKDPALYDFCENRFDISNSWKICVPNPPPVDMVASIGKEIIQIQNIERCYDPNCKQLETKRLCSIQAGCNFCELDMDGHPLSQPLCDDMDKCYFGQVGFESPYDEMFDFVNDIFDGSEGTTKMGTIIGGVAVVAIVMASLITICVKRLGGTSSASTNQVNQPGGSGVEQQNAPQHKG